MTFGELVQIIPPHQQIRYSITCLTDNDRGRTYDSQLMNGFVAKLEKHIYDACVTGIETVTEEPEIIRIYARQYISFSDL